MHQYKGYTKAQLDFKQTYRDINPFTKEAKAQRNQRYTENAVYVLQRLGLSRSQSYRLLVGIHELSDYSSLIFAPTAIIKATLVDVLEAELLPSPQYSLFDLYDTSTNSFDPINGIVLLRIVLEGLTKATNDSARNRFADSDAAPNNTYDKMVMNNLDRYSSLMGDNMDLKREFENTWKENGWDDFMSPKNSKTKQQSRSKSGSDARYYDRERMQRDARDIGRDRDRIDRDNDREERGRTA